MSDIRYTDSELRRYDGLLESALDADYPDYRLIRTYAREAARIAHDLGYTQRQLAYQTIARQTGEGAKHEN
jgi:hypothetical protein